MSRLLLIVLWFVLKSFGTGHGKKDGNAVHEPEKVEMDGVNVGPANLLIFHPVCARLARPRR